MVSDIYFTRRFSLDNDGFFYLEQVNNISPAFRTLELIEIESDSQAFQESVLILAKWIASPDVGNNATTSKES